MKKMKKLLAVCLSFLLCAATGCGVLENPSASGSTSGSTSGSGYSSAGSSTGSNAGSNSGSSSGNDQGADQGGDQGADQGGDQGADQGGNQGGDQGADQGGEEDPYAQEAITPSSSWNDDNELSILAIGNSFSVDGMEYVSQIAKNLGVEKVTLGNLYIGGCTLEKHATNLRENKNAYTYWKNTTGTWSSSQGKRIRDAIQSDEWDYISLQQASGSSGLADTYNEDLTYLQQTVKQLAGEETKIVWHMTWAYDTTSNHNEFVKYGNNQLTMYNGIVDAVKSKVLQSDISSIVIPSGTAIQNARTSYLVNTLTRDGYHLDYNIGRYIAGLTWVGRLTGLDISNVTYAPEAVTEATDKAAAKECAASALANPFSITASTYQEKPAVDLTQYRKLDLSLTQGYYNSSDQNNYTTLMTSASNSNQYFATQKFTKETLPVGSIILLESGWQYRPEGWTSETYVSGVARPSETTTERLVITESWWSGYLYRAFNISKKNKPSIAGQSAQAAAAFSIYVPIGTQGSQQPQQPSETQYQVLDITWTAGKYYNSSQSTQLVTATDAAFGARYYATQKFTKETLPIGSKIVIASGWQYRPDGWTSETGNTAGRPGNVTTSEIIIDEAWWGSYVYRGFNISKTDNSSLTGKEVEVAAAFIIYVPIK